MCIHDSKRPPTCFLSYSMIKLMHFFFHLSNSHITVINIHYNANLFDPRHVIFFEKFPFTYKLGLQSMKTRAHNIKRNILHA